MQKILIVEDDKIQSEQLYKGILQQYPNWCIVCASDYDSAKTYIENSLMQESFSLFLLDIQLSQTPGDQGGFLLSEIIRSYQQYYSTPILFLTSITDQIQHALHSYHCYNYIQKPYSIDDILFQIHQMMATGMLNLKTLIIRDTCRIRHRLSPDDILYIESKNHTLILMTLQGPLTTREYTLQSLLSELNFDFLRCHRKYIINKNHIRNYDETNRFLTICQFSIPVGRTYQKNLESVLFHP